jgi:DNA-binding transcriptional LysR family regulator
MELDSIEAILSCIEAGLGVGFASIWAVDRQGRQSILSKIRIRNHRIERTLSFVMPPGSILSSSAEVMMRFLQDSVSSTKSLHTPQSM